MAGHYSCFLRRTTGGRNSAVVSTRTCCSVLLRYMMYIWTDVLTETEFLLFRKATSVRWAGPGPISLHFIIIMVPIKNMVIVNHHRLLQLCTDTLSVKSYNRRKLRDLHDDWMGGGGGSYCTVCTCTVYSSTSKALARPPFPPGNIMMDDHGRLWDLGPP